MTDPEPRFSETKSMIGIVDSMRQENEELKAENARLGKTILRMRNELITQSASRLYGAFAAAANAKSMEYCVIRATELIDEEYGIKPGAPTT